MDEFDLKKFLAQTAQAGEDETIRMIMGDEKEAIGLNEYLSDIHNSGARIIANYIAEDEVHHLLALIAGISTAEVMFSSLGSDHENMLHLTRFVASHGDIVTALTLSIMCATVGLVCREEWR